MSQYMRLWPYAKRYLKWTILAIVCTSIVSSTSGLVAWLVKPVINNIVGKSDVSVILLSLGVTGVYFAKGFFSYWQSYFIQYASLNVVRDIRNDLYSHMVYLPLKEYHKSPTGKLISNMMNDVGMLSRLMAGLIKDFLQQSFTIVGLLAVIFVRDWRLALIAILVFPISGIFVNKYGKRMRRISRKAQQNIATLSNILHENFTGVRIVKAFTMEDEEKQKFKNQNEENTRINLKSARVNSLVAPTMEAIGGVGLGMIIYYGVSRIKSGGMTAGDFLSFTVALGLLYGPVKALGNIHNSMQQALAASERIFDVLDTATEMEAMDTGIKGPDGVNEKIEYRNVAFRYNEAEDYVLKDINLTIKKGEVIAIVGSSGGGKTTLVNLLPRFFDIDGGAILIDGVDIREYTLRTLRQQISVVTQDTILFNDTIRNNISYGTMQYTEDSILGAAKAAHADKFIEKMPEKYDTVIGEKGVRLSGGEKQRISIARAILKDSPILVLDEATSALDTESERIVQTALENLMKNRTTLVIAHRLSTIINADKIVVIDKGVVAGMGRHSELLESSSIYRNLYEMQFGRLEGNRAKV